MQRGGSTGRYESRQMNPVNKSGLLRVEANLDIEIDGQLAQLRGQGSHLQLILRQPEMLYQMTESSFVSPKRAAASLAMIGLTLTVTDGRRTLIKVGPDVSSVLGDLIIGSRHVAPAGLWGLLGLLRSYWVYRRKARI